MGQTRSFLGYWKVISVHVERWSYGRFQDDNNIFFKMKNDLTTGTWQGDIWCPKNILVLHFWCTKCFVLWLVPFDQSYYKNLFSLALDSSWYSANTHQNSRGYHWYPYPWTTRTTTNDPPLKALCCQVSLVLQAPGPSKKSTCQNCNHWSTWWFKTDKSKRKGVCFRRERKLQPDRPYCWKKSFCVNLISLFLFHALCLTDLMPLLFADRPPPSSL